jgi:hypothetical protein
MSVRTILENDGELNLFQKVLKLLSDYTDQYPASGVDGMLEDLRTNKAAVLPKGELEKEIIEYAMSIGTHPAGAYQQLSNLRFADLPLCLRPLYQSVDKEEVAMWGQGDKVSDKIISMLDFKKEGDVKGFVDKAGEKVKLLSKEGKK